VHGEKASVEGNIALCRMKKQAGMAFCANGLDGGSRAGRGLQYAGNATA
jgi:hypothetical protein